MNRSVNNNFAYKLLCPTFDGSNFKEWILKLEQYFEAEMVPDSAKVRVVMLHLEGCALQWHQFVSKNQRGLHQVNWNEYLALIHGRFALEGFEDPFADLVALRQTESVHRYYEEFIQLLNQVELPDDYVLSMFKNHLRIEISPMVKLLNPKNLIDAFNLAKHVEEMVFPKKLSMNTTRGFSPTSLSVVYSKPGANYSKGGGGTSGAASGYPQPKFTTPESSNSGNTKPASGANHREPGKMLSSNEIEERRRKGLCFWCAAKYTPGHKYAKTQLYQIFVEGNEEELEPEIFLNCEDNHELLASDKQLEEEPKLSLNALWGDSHVETMKLMFTTGGCQGIALVDTGSTHNFVSYGMVKRMRLRVHQGTQLKVTMADENCLTTGGECKGVEWHVQGHQFVADFLVLPLKNCDMVLVIQWLTGLGNVKWNFAEHIMEFQHSGDRVKLMEIQAGELQWIETNACEKLLRMHRGSYSAVVYLINPQLGVTTRDEVLPVEIQELLLQFKDVFEEPQGLPPDRGHDHKIKLVKEETVVKVKPYRHPTYQKDAIEKMVKEMLQAGIIRDSDSSFPSPVVMVRKKYDTWRMCVDYRRLNQFTIKDSFPMPVIEELLDELGSASFFSKLDLRSGYHQIRMHEADIPKTTFRTHEGHYEFLVMPFGLTNAPAIFQGLMNRVFKPQLRKYVLVFFDDILVYSPDWNSHLLYLRKVLKVLRTQKLYAKQSKCCFRAVEVDYLGYVISKGTILMDQSKVKCIREWPTPKSVKELRGFIGLSGYYRRFVQGYGCIARPLTELLKKDGWKWSQVEESAFERLKQCVSSAPVLALPDFNVPFIVETDASNVGVGAVLVQKGRPVAFYSKGLRV
ncbi:hypothetical protein HRI_000881700 [Hibiscus trionum]|uniref:Reverse transcriptase domain-containing protein n=1 Tax=Hibiscus trionum TaxID=183268 RepID=A0A9W7LPH6_HIBTR|nr:hypothetical protein HRI_000881700 [Hibiscus trionum]